MQVIDDLFLPDKPLFMFKRPGNLYDVKKKVIAGMQARHRKVTGKGHILPKQIQLIMRMPLLSIILQKNCTTR
jgi:hypothetical protein